MVTASIDFGTTNSVAGISNNGNIDMVQLGKKTLDTKSVLFYSFEDKKFYVGDDAIDELKIGSMGRYLVSLKSFLGHEKEIETTLGTNIYTLENLISTMLRRFKWKIEQKANTQVDSVVLGRPVRFNDNSDTLDKQAQNRLLKAANLAGFKNVIFQYEPLAAAYAYEEKIDKEELILVADIGGGTTDYSIIRVGGNLKNKIDRKDDILATHGVYVGGNNFDSEIINNYITPFLGKDTPYKIMGKKMRIGGSLYTDLAQWHRFQKMYDQEIISKIEKLIFMSYEKEKIGRLLELIKEHLYFDFSEKIINSKIDLSSNKYTNLNMNIFKNPFELQISRESFNNSIQKEILNIDNALTETLKKANINFNQIDKVFLTGGSTLVPLVKEIYTKHFSKEKIMHTDVFTSVGYGLALFSSKKIFN